MSESYDEKMKKMEEAWTEFYDLFEKWRSLPEFFECRKLMFDYITWNG